MKFAKAAQRLQADRVILGKRKTDNIGGRIDRSTQERELSKFKFFLLLNSSPTLPYHALITARLSGFHHGPFYIYLAVLAFFATPDLIGDFAQKFTLGQTQNDSF